MDLTPENAKRVANSQPNSRVYKYKSLGEYSAIALIRPHNERKKVWRYRCNGTTLDFPASKFNSLAEFEEYIAVVAAK